MYNGKKTHDIHFRDGIFVAATMAAEVPMNAMMTLINSLLVNIILILVLVLLVLKKNSVFGHARRKDGIAVLS